MDFAAVAAASSSLKAAIDITQSLIGLGVGQAMQAKVIELQGRIFDAQQAMLSVNQERATLVDRVADLKATIVRMEDWDTEKQRYELKELAPGISVYALKLEMAGAEPPHHLCPNCYEDAKKSILQGQTLQKYAGRERKVCQRCGLKLEYFRSDLPAKPPLQPRVSRNPYF